MNVLLTGATGFLGFRTLEKLIETRGVDHIIASGRKLKKGMEVESPKVEYKLGDLSDENTVRDLCENVDAIIHCAALASPWGDRDVFYQANVLPQKYLIKYANEFGIKRFVYVSTPSVYMNYRPRKLVNESEELPKKMVNNYSITKREAEILLEETDLDYVIIRPRGLIGRGDTVIMPRLIRAYKEGKLKVIGNGQNKVDLTSVSNVADALILSLFVKGNGLNQTYNITNGEPVEMWKFIEEVLFRLGMDFHAKKVPFRLAFFVSYLMELKSKMSISKREPVLTRYSVSTLAHSFSLDISKARKLLGYTPKVSTKEALNEFVEWHKSMNN